jgi:hypothetical protein
MARDDDDDPPKPAPTGNRNRALALGVAIPLVICCVCGGGAMLARGAFARYVARATLAGYGISCGDGFDVAPDTSFAHAEIAPCTCTMDDGAVESFEIVTPMTVDLDGQTVTHVHAGTLRVAMRPSSAAVDAGSLGPLASMLGVPARIGGLVNAAANLASLDAPPIDVTTLEVTQSGQVAVSVDTLAIDGASPLGVTAHQVTMPALAGPLGAHADVTIDALTGTASASDVHLEGDLALSGSAPLVGTVSRSGHVVVSGTGLDGDAPTYRVEL